MSTKLPKEYIALLGQYNDEDLAKLADVAVEVVTAARAAAATKTAETGEKARAAAATKTAETGEKAPVLDAPKPPAPERERAAEVLPNLGIIMIEVPEGVDRDKLKAQIDEIVAKAIRAAEGAPSALKYIGDEKTLRHPVSGKKLIVRYGDVLKGDEAKLIWENYPELAKAL